MPATAIGLDLGGTRLKLAVLDAAGEVLERELLPSRALEGPEAALQSIEEALRRVQGRLDGAAIRVGLGLPGVVDPVEGRLMGATPHLPGAEAIAWRAAVQSIAQCPVVVDNDANAATHAELKLGALAGREHGLVVLIGTGVGAGLVVGGVVYRGDQGGAGEIGHLPIGTGELACACGVPGCVEPDMSGEGVARAAARRGKPWGDFKAVWAAAATGDTIANELIDRLADRLGATLAIAAQLLDPGTIVVGGGVAGAGAPLIDRIRDGFRRHATAGAADRTRIVESRLEGHAGAIGAALLAQAATD